MVTNKQFNNLPINVGNNNEISMLELAEIIKEILHSDSKNVFLPSVQDDPQRRCPDTKKLETIGWNPQISLQQGLVKTIDWIRKNYI